MAEIGGMPYSNLVEEDAFTPFVAGTIELKKNFHGMQTSTRIAAYVAAGLKNIP